MNLFHTISFWIVKKWYGILVAQAILFATVYLTIWQISFQIGLDECLRVIRARSDDQIER